jgi:hypothetical protein
MGFRETTFLEVISLYALWSDINAFADTKGQADVTGSVIGGGGGLLRKNVLPMSNGITVRS